MVILTTIFVYIFPLICLSCLGLRILGIGRNEYIELMNQCRTKNKLFRRKHEIRPMLPSQPININVDPWWVVDVGCLYEDDIKVKISISLNKFSFISLNQGLRYIYTNTELVQAKIKYCYFVINIFYSTPI